MQHHFSATDQTCMYCGLTRFDAENDARKWPCKKTLSTREYLFISPSETSWLTTSRGVKQ